jgi:hypothetical protein
MLEPWPLVTQTGRARCQVDGDSIKYGPDAIPVIRFDILIELLPLVGGIVPETTEIKKTNSAIFVHRIAVEVHQISVNYRGCLKLCQGSEDSRTIDLSIGSSEIKW